jgi:aspartate/tyrosine/aromatic aminotransferase
VKKLVEEYHIYLLSSGRISIAGLNDGNVAYVAKAFDAVTRSSKI